MGQRCPWVVIGLVAAGLGVTGCGTSSASYGEVSQSGPAQVEPVTGTDINRVTLARASAEKLGVRTAAVEGAPAPATADAGASPETSVPVAAVIYDKDGNTWVYVSEGSRTFQRQAVSVARVDGGNAILRSGPPVGTQVVVVGAQELLGAELGVAGE